MPSLLPSIMHFNSILWHHAVASQTVGLPVLLHDINLLIGSNIGATFASSTGIWTLANGAVLNAGAASASLLASLGKVALTMGAIGVGSTVAIKNAYNLAKEKYKNRTKKVKIEKHNIFDNINDAFKKHTEKSKEETKEKTKKEPEKVVNTEKTEDKKPFFRGDVNDRINQTVNYLIKKNVISEPTKKELEKMSKEEFIAKFKDIFNEHYQVNKTEDKNESKTTTFYRDDIAPEINEYIQNAINKGNYSSEAEVEALYQIDPENLTEWIKYEMNFSKEETEENKMGGK